jgi:hypothetical protein
MGIPQEFIFGGLNFTGSSVSLRTLENDFIQNRSQLLDLVEWVKDKVKSWLSCPDVTSLRFADFRMADDIQRNQQLIGLNAAGKISDQTLLTELGYKFDDEVKKRLGEVHIQNYMQDLLIKGQARSQGEAQMITANFQQKLTEASPTAVQGVHSANSISLEHDNTGQIGMMVQKLVKMQKPQAEGAIAELKSQVPEIAVPIEQGYLAMMKQIEMQQQQQTANQATAMMMMDPMQAAQAGIAQYAQLPEGIAPGQIGMQQQQLAMQQQAQQQAAKGNTKAPANSTKPAPDQKPPRRQGGV